MEDSEKFISSLDDDESKEDENHHENGSLNEVMSKLLFYQVSVK